MASLENGTSPGRAWVWFLDYVPESPTVFGHGGTFLANAISEIALALVLALPPVVAVTGVSSLAAVLLIGGHVVWCGFNTLTFGRLARRSPAAFRFGSVFDLLAGLAVACAFPVLGGNPNTLLWSLAILYATLDGGIAESRPSRLFLLAHVLAPLLTIPAFDWRHDGWAVAGPVITSAVSGVAFHYQATRMVAWRRLRERHEGALRQLKEQQHELGRLRLARDLHDSLGSTLGLLALHADLLERHRHDPDQVTQLATLTREAARGGLGDLRGVLEAMAPDKETLTALAAALGELARRTAPGIRVDLLLAEGGETSVPSTARLALVRVFQEAVHNAVVHGGARSIRATLGAATGWRLEVVDDGIGFDPATDAEGRGVPGMRARAAELGGTFTVEARPGGGTQLRLWMPRTLELTS